MGRLMPQRYMQETMYIKKNTLFWFDNFCMIFLNHSLREKLFNILNYLIENKIAEFILLATTGRHRF